MVHSLNPTISSISANIYLYIFSMTFAYIFTTTFLFTFRVGPTKEEEPKTPNIQLINYSSTSSSPIHSPSSPVGTEKSWLRISNFCTCCAFDIACLLALEIPSSMAFFTYMRSNRKTSYQPSNLLC